MNEPMIIAEQLHEYRLVVDGPSNVRIFQMRLIDMMGREYQLIQTHHRSRQLPPIH